MFFLSDKLFKGHANITVDKLIEYITAIVLLSLLSLLSTCVELLIIQKQLAPEFLVMPSLYSL